jgi:ribosome-associated protein
MRGTTGTDEAALGADQVREWAVAAARAASDKQARDVVVLDVGEVSSIGDWFVICDAGSDRQVKTVVEEIERRVAEVGGPEPRSVEGLEHRHWVLVDYGDVVVHVFVAEARAYYELERLWSDVARLDWSAEENPSARGEEPVA